MTNFEKISLDPNFFVNTQLNDDNVMEKRTKMLDKLLKFIKPSSNTKIIFDDGFLLEEEYNQLNQNLEDRYFKRVLGSLLNRPLPQKNLIEIQGKTEQVNELLGKHECSNVHRLLLEMIVQETDLIIILADIEQEPTGLYNPELRLHICKTLGREAIIYASEIIKPIPFIMTEGKTDWKHLKVALQHLKRQGCFLGLIVELDEFEETRGDKYLRKICEGASKAKSDVTNICVFDHDDTHIIEKMSGLSEIYKYWGNNVYSFAIPVPSHRQNIPDHVCIELYYKDDEITQIDNDGKRLFLSNEFELTENEQKRKHITEQEIFCWVDPSKKVIHSGMGGFRPKNKLLSKEEFVNHILNRDTGFKDFDFSEFSKIFDVIANIIDDAISRDI